MRERLRKKLRLGEIREYGFDVPYRLRDGASETEADDFLFRFLEQAIEAHSLAFGGGGGPPAFEFCVVSDHRGSPTQEQRSAVGAWLDAVQSAMEGRFGPGGTDVWLSHLASLCWFFRLKTVAESHLFAHHLEETDSIWDVTTAIRACRRDLAVRDRTEIPL